MKKVQDGEEEEEKFIFTIPLGNPWKNCRVPYEFSNPLSSHLEEQIEHALSIWKNGQHILKVVSNSTLFFFFFNAFLKSLSRKQKTMKITLHFVKQVKGFVNLLLE